MASSSESCVTGSNRGRVLCYDAIDDSGDVDELERQCEYFRRVERLPDVKVITGHVRRAGIRARNGKERREQKGVDVRLAIDALEAGRTGLVSAIAIVSGDADFAPLADAIRRAGPHVLVLGFERSLSSNLRDAADRVVLLPNADWCPDWWLLPT